jgi:hypothetical protein
MVRSRPSPGNEPGGRAPGSPHRAFVVSPSERRAFESTQPKPMPVAWAPLHRPHFLAPRPPPENAGDELSSAVPDVAARDLTSPLIKNDVSDRLILATRRSQRWLVGL